MPQYYRTLMSSNNLLSFPCRVSLNCHKWDSAKEKKPCSELPKEHPVMACLRAERWKLLPWASHIWGWPKSFLISIKQRQAVTRHSSCSRINIGTLRNNLLMEIEALKIIPQLVNPKSSANPHQDRIRKMSKQVLLLVNIKTVMPALFPPLGSSVPSHSYQEAFLAGYLLW